jgi:hypothetical protein
MNGLLSTPYKYDGNFIEGTVTSVDPIRFSCCVRTSKGQILKEVTWLLPTGGTGKNGIHCTPTMGDRVLITTSISYPIIIGSIPRSNLPVSNQSSISGEDILADAGNSTNLKNGYVLNPGKPKDMVPGDVIVTNESGGLFGVLFSGSIIAKASEVAQIFLTRFDDLVRIVGRNFQRFSDASSQVVANIQGRLYEWRGVDKSLSRNLTNLERYNEVYGDVAAGEILRGEPDINTVLPAVDTRVRKYWLKWTDGHTVMSDTTLDTGDMTIIVDKDNSITTNNHYNSLWKTHVNDLGNTGRYSDIEQNQTHINIDFNNRSVADFDNTKIEVNFKPGVSKALFDGTKVVINHNNSIVTIRDDIISLESNGHYCRIDNTGTHLG